MLAGKSKETGKSSEGFKKAGTSGDGLAPLPEHCLQRHVVFLVSALIIVPYRCGKVTEKLGEIYRGKQKEHVPGTGRKSQLLPFRTFCKRV